ncbi:hypothetical protein D3C76_1437730 [compost metagenome]
MLEQRIAVPHVDVTVITQQDRFRQRLDTLQGFENVAPVAGSDIDDVYSHTLFAQASHGQAQQLLDVQFALANATPTDRLQVVAVDHPPQRALPGRLVPVHVIQGAA